MSMCLFCSYSGANILNNLYLEENRNQEFHFDHKKSRLLAASTPDTMPLMGGYASTSQNPTICKPRCKEPPSKSPLFRLPM